ncbi:uncharacterized protein si:dkey-29h14.10 isoform X1 [Heterodontus francisci]|uniref:uncharacterized protein si:dkey-29h14.10 isoform X1 n=1 Tax=Heterodontus francisci TaxID=7792 RepID=UPI00355BC2CF
MSTQTDLRRHYYVLGTSMSPAVVEQITYFLYSTRILNQYELNAISSKSEMLSKASELLSAVIRKGQKACGIFFQALETCDPHLSEQIIGKQVNSTGHTLPTSSFLRPVPSMRPHVSKPPSTAEASSSQKQFQSPVKFKICICNSSLNNCIFGSNNKMSIMRTMSLSEPNNFVEPETSTNTEHGKVLDVTANSRTCSSSNELSASSTEAIQGETDIEIITSKLQNVTFGDRNTFTVVEELSDEDDNEEKELEEEYEENECEEKEDTEQLTEEGR